MAQAVSCQPVTQKAQSGTVTGFYTSSLVFSCKYHSTATSDTFCHLGHEQ
jgi:hypothetical protein